MDTPSNDQILWTIIRDRTNAIAYDKYATYIKNVLCEGRDHPLFEKSTGPCSKAWKDEDDPKSDEGKPRSEFWQETNRKVVTAERAKILQRFPIPNARQTLELLDLATEVFLQIQSGLLVSDVADDKLLTEEKSRMGNAALNEVNLTDALKNLGKRGSSLMWSQVVGELEPSGIKVMAAGDLALCDKIIASRYKCPLFLELIYAYWLEESGLIQTINAICMRVLNCSGNLRDPLTSLQLMPLRPLAGLLEAFANSSERVKLCFRESEYAAEYGLTLYGDAAGRCKSTDIRSDFIPAFHVLLRTALQYYKDSANRDITPDGFPLLNVIRELHLVLAQGSTNMFSEYPWRTRKELLIIQWLLSQPEIQGFVGGNPMMPNQPKWMKAVDAMRRLQSWGPQSARGFADLAETGERILLSIRYPNWTDLSKTGDDAKNWANYWKTEVQTYVQAYRTVTGVDLNVPPAGGQSQVDTRLPSELIRAASGMGRQAA